MSEFKNDYGNKEGYPPVAFYFSVSFPDDPNIKATSFKEVSGIGVEMETESVAEGGENRFTHQLPKRAKHGNLVLKRGLASTKSKFVNWLRTTLESDFSKAFVTSSVQVNLLNPEGNIVDSWLFSNAYPVKWDIEAFESQKNEVAIESVEFCYTTVKRNKTSG
jgi:phage tail-like protein